MDRTAHPRSAKIGRLFQSERNKFHSHRWLLPREQSREFDQSGDTARVVVGSRQCSGSIVMRADDDALFRLWSKLSDYVSIRLALDAIRLLRNEPCGLAKFVFNVLRDQIEILD